MKSLISLFLHYFNISNVIVNSSIVGDTNNDDQVNVLDVVILVNMILSYEI